MRWTVASASAVRPSESRDSWRIWSCSIASLGIEVDRLLVVVDGLVGLVQPQVQVTDAVVDGDVAVLLTLCVSDDLKVDLECLIELLFLLEFGCLFFQLLDVGHVGGRAM